MNAPGPAAPARDLLTSYFRSDDALRSRSVSDVLLLDALELPEVPVWLQAEWEREAAHDLDLEPGDVEALSLPRTRMRWPGYRRCVDAATQWTQKLGLANGTLASSDVALMACRGARYHHDGAAYGGVAFCNVFLSGDKGLDLHFPAMGRRIPLRHGTAVVFDTAQPHAVIPRGKDRFDAADFAPGRDGLLVFLTWELAIEQAALASKLGITFDVDPAGALPADDGQLRRNGKTAMVCPASGQWRQALPAG